MRTSESQSPRILVVDDDAVVRRMLSDTLGRAGYAVVQACSTTEALRVAADEEPALAIVALVLPDGDGIELLGQLRASWPTLPALVVAACVELRSIVEAMRRGAHDYLSKPLHPDVLLSARRAPLARPPLLKAPVRPAGPPLVGASAATAPGGRAAGGRLAGGGTGPGARAPPRGGRPGDPLPLARHFLAEAGALHGRQFLGFTPDAEHRLLGHGWPGNVRELQETIARIAEGLTGGPPRGEPLAPATPRAAPPRVPIRHPPPPQEIEGADTD